MFGLNGDVGAIAPTKTPAVEPAQCEHNFKSPPICVLMYTPAT